MKTLSAIGLLTAFCFLAGACGDEEPDKLSKEEAAELAKADNMRDFCAEFGWYGDGVCDDFCLTPDPDCGDGACGVGENKCNCPGDCADPCGGLIGMFCLRFDQVCIDDPTDDCNPDAGGRDCAGICVNGQGGGSCWATVSTEDSYYERYEAIGAANRCRSDKNCVTSGCSDEVCAAESLFTTCEAIPAPDGSCGCLDGECQWISCDE